MSWIRGVKVLHDKSSQRGEDLGGWKICGETVDDAESRLQEVKRVQVTEWRNLRGKEHRHRRLLARPQ